MTPLPASASTVFIVDDDEAVRDSLRLLIESVGLRVEPFADARELLEAYDADRPSTTFDDIAGYTGVKQEITEVVDFLRMPERFREQRRVVVVTLHASPRAPEVNERAANRQRLERKRDNAVCGHVSRSACL